MRNSTTKNDLPFRTLLNIKQVSELTGYAVSTIRTKHCKESYVYDPTFPRPLKFTGRTVRYDRDELHAWIEKAAAKRTVGVAS